MIANIFNLAQYIPILNEYEYELNVAIYTIFIEEVISILKKYLDRYIVDIECNFYENKKDAEKERSYNDVEIKAEEDPNRLYLGVKYSGYYKELKNYYLEIRFPTWVDLNGISGTSIFKLEDKEIRLGISVSNIIIDFSELDTEGDNYKDGVQITPLDFIINSIENLGCKELVEIKIRQKKRWNIHYFKSNKLKIFIDL